MDKRFDEVINSGTLETLVEYMNEIHSEFKKEAYVALSGNKSAARRARVATLKLEKLCKRFRDLTLGRTKATIVPSKK